MYLASFYYLATGEGLTIGFYTGKSPKEAQDLVPGFYRPAAAVHAVEEILQADPEHDVLSESSPAFAAYNLRRYFPEVYQQLKARDAHVEMQLTYHFNKS